MKKRALLCIASILTMGILALDYETMNIKELRDLLSQERNAVRRKSIAAAILAKERDGAGQATSQPEPTKQPSAPRQPKQYDDIQQALAKVTEAIRRVKDAARELGNEKIIQEIQKAAAS